MPTRTSPHQAEDRRPLLSVADLARYLQVDEQTIYGWRKRKFGDRGPKAVLVGGQLRFSWRAIDDWLASRPAN